MVGISKGENLMIMCPLCNRKWLDGHPRQEIEYKSINRYTRCTTCMKEYTGEILRDRSINENQVVDFVVKGIEAGIKTNCCHYYEFKQMANKIIRRQKV